MEKGDKLCVAERIHFPLIKAIKFLIPVLGVPFWLEQTAGSLGFAEVAE